MFVVHDLLILVLLLNVPCHGKVHQAGEVSDEDFGTNLVTYMRNDANLDLPLDEEYEDLRAELLAYHTALASISSSSNRRSMKSTPCWSLGGICVDHTLCTGFRFLTEVPGCKNRQMVCCFAWNKFKVKDWRHKGLGLLAMPWSLKSEFGGRGIIDTINDAKDHHRHKNKPHNKKLKLGKQTKKGKNIRKLEKIQPQPLKQKVEGAKKSKTQQLSHQLLLKDVIQMNDKQIGIENEVDYKTVDDETYNTGLINFKTEGEYDEKEDEYVGTEEEYGETKEDYAKTYYGNIGKLNNKRLQYKNNKKRVFNGDEEIEENYGIRDDIYGIKENNTDLKIGRNKLKKPVNKKSIALIVRAPNK